MLNDNKSIENKQINVISPLVKKIMMFNSIFMMGSMVIVVFIFAVFFNLLQLHSQENLKH